MPWQRRPGPGGCWWSPDAGLVRGTAVGLLRLFVAVPEEIQAVAGRVWERAPGNRQALLLATVPGLGCYSALLAGAENKEVSRFLTARLLSSCAGLVPSTYASGGVVTHGAITRRGPRFVCWTLVETAMHAVRRPGPLQEFYRRLLVGKGAQKATVAAAGKLSEAVFWMLTMGRSYRKMGPCLAPEARRTRDPTTWRTAKAGLVTLQPASHAGHIVLGQGWKVPLGGARRKASGGPGGDGRAALREP
jgi:hypothetical protein